MVKSKLGVKWEKYQKALSFYNECMTDADFERLPLSYDTGFTNPSWLTEVKIQQMYKEIQDFQAKEFRRLSRGRKQKQNITRSIVRYRA